MKAVRSKKGDTLIEILVAVAVLLVVTICITTTQSKILNLDEKSEERIHFSSVLKEIHEYYQAYGNNVYNGDTLVTDKIDWANKYFGENLYSYISGGTFRAYYDEEYNAVSKSSKEIKFYLEFKIVDTYMTLSVREIKEDGTEKSIYEDVEYGYNGSDSNYVICYEKIAKELEDAVKGKTTTELLKYLNEDGQYLMYKYYYFYYDGVGRSIEESDYNALDDANKKIETYKVYYELENERLKAHIFFVNDKETSYIQSVDYGYPVDILKNRIAKEVINLHLAFQVNEGTTEYWSESYAKITSETDIVNNNYYYITEVKSGIFTLKDKDGNVYLSLNRNNKDVFQSFNVNQLGIITDDASYLTINLKYESANGNIHLSFNDEDKDHSSSNIYDLLNGTEDKDNKKLLDIYNQIVFNANNYTDYIFNDYYITYYEDLSVCETVILDKEGNKVTETVGEEAANKKEKYRITAKEIDGRVIITLEEINTINNVTTYNTMLVTVSNVTQSLKKYSLYQDIVTNFENFKADRLITKLAEEQEKDSTITSVVFEAKDFDLWREDYFEKTYVINDAVTTHYAKAENGQYTYSLDDTYFKVSSYNSETINGEPNLQKQNGTSEITISLVDEILRIDIGENIGDNTKTSIFSSDYKRVLKELLIPIKNNEYQNTNLFTSGEYFAGYFVDWQFVDGNLVVSVYDKFTGKEIVTVDEGTSFEINSSKDNADNVTGFIIYKNDKDGKTIITKEFVLSGGYINEKK